MHGHYSWMPHYNKTLLLIKALSVGSHVYRINYKLL
jgi:hypothetical protein